MKICANCGLKLSWFLGGKYCGPCGRDSRSGKGFRRAYMSKLPSDIRAAARRGWW